MNVSINKLAHNYLNDVIENSEYYQNLDDVSEKVINEDYVLLQGLFNLTYMDSAIFLINIYYGYSTITMPFLTHIYRKAFHKDVCDLIAEVTNGAAV